MISFDYWGDQKMAEILRENGSSLSLHGVYGLFHGCVAATRLVPLSMCLPLIFEDDTLDSDERYYAILTGLIPLFSLILQWKPETEEFPQPEIFFPETPEGLKIRMANWVSFIKTFIDALEWGETEEADLSEDVVDAIKDLFQVEATFEESVQVVGKQRYGEVELKGIFESLQDMEDLIADAVARVNLGLFEAREKAWESGEGTIGDFDEYPKPERSVRIGRNEPCPCGSGKKYKKCCGLRN